MQKYVGKHWLIGRVNEMRTLAKLSPGTKLGVAFFQSCPRFRAAVNTIKECYVKGLSRTELEGARGGDGSASESETRVVGTGEMAICMEWVPVGELDLSLDTQCRSKLLSVAEYNVDPVVEPLTKAAQKELARQEGVSKQRKKDTSTGDTADTLKQQEGLRDANTEFVRVTGKAFTTHVQYELVNIDVLDKEKRDMVFPPLSKDIDVFLLDLPYGKGGMYGAWDTLIPDDQVSVACFVCLFRTRNSCLHITHLFFASHAHIRVLVSAVAVAAVLAPRGQQTQGLRRVCLVWVRAASAADGD